MTDFGGKLRQARERRGISLRQIAASTKISVGALEALERNDVSKLPGGLFSRAFVRSYAAEVGLDQDATVREFLELFEQRQTEESAVRQPLLSDEESQFESEQRMAGVVLKLVVIAIPLVIAILYFTLRSRPAPPREEEAPAPVTQRPAAPSPADAAQPSAPPQTTPAVLPPPVLRAAQDAGSPSGSTSQTAVSAPRSTTPATSPQPSIAAVPGQMTLDVHPSGACWVSVTVDGRRAFGKVMQAGDRERLVVIREAVIEIGDAGAFAYSVDGKEGQPLGTAGQVKTLRLAVPPAPPR